MHFPQLFAFKWVPMQGMCLFQIVFMLLDAPLKLFVCEPVQDDVHRCLRAWQPHQRGSGMRCCCCFVRLLLSFRGAGLQSSTVASERHLLCPLVPAASRAACGRTSSPQSWDLSHVRTIFYKKKKSAGTAQVERDGLPVGKPCEKQGWFS